MAKMQSGAGHELGLLSQDISPSQGFLNKMCTSDELEKDMEGALHRYVEKAELLINKYVMMIVEPDSGSKLGDMLRETQVVKKQLTGTVGCIYMSQHAGESDCRPHCRQPRFRADHLKLVVNGERAGVGIVRVWGRNAQKLPLPHRGCRQGGPRSKHQQMLPSE